METMKVLVTGGSGFVGAQVARLLVAESHQVRLLLRPTSPRLLIHDLPFEEWIGDIQDPHAVMSAVAGCSVVFHVAGFVSHWSRDKERLYRINQEGTRHVVAACLRHRVKRLIHTSSIAALGQVPEGGLGNERLVYDWWFANLHYNNSKYLAEQEVLNGVAQGLDAVIVNPAVIFGAGEIDAQSGALLLRARQGKLKATIGGGACTCDVEDVARGHLLAWKKGKRGERYILGGENLSWESIMTLACEVVGAPAPRYRLPNGLLRSWIRLSDFAFTLFHKRPPWPRDYLHYLGRLYYFSSAKAQQELAYTITPFRQTLEKADQWFLENNYFKP